MTHEAEMRLPRQWGRTSGVPFENGTNVRLTQKAIRALANPNRRTGKAVDWDNRVGVVKHCNAYSVSVRWPDRKSDDWLPVKAVERVNMEDQTEHLELTVPSGMCKLTFDTFVSTGPQGCDTSPGIGLEIEAALVMGRTDTGLQPRNGRFVLGIGVIGRSQALELRNMLEVFLKNCERNGIK